jgi:4-phospho-D-threonate 3-dehydrogenase / 4-phospho-D-erythronate 3-dehydrogenase
VSALPVVAATIGDPAGIGPEVCVKAAAESREHCRVLLIGDADAVGEAMKTSGIARPLRRVASASDLEKDAVNVLDPGGRKPGYYSIGKASAAAGSAVLDWLRLGSELGTRGEIQGMVMGPVDGESLKLSGRLDDIDDLQPRGTYMLRISGALRVVPISEHIRLRDVIDTVKAPRVLELIRMLDANLRKWGLQRPRIAVAGLNPHALFEEDREEIAPAVQAARSQGIEASGPISPDSVFRMTLEGRYDAVVTMYHDQGQIAVKTAAFEGACTIYMGLPYVLLNVPHGSAFDIAGKGVAQHQSMLAAIKTAAALAAGRGFL